MSDGAVQEVDAKAFDQIVASSTVPVVADFWAPWCGPCLMQGPILDEVAKGAGPNAIVAKINVDEEPGIASQFGVQSIPTLLVLKDGQILQRLVGVQSAQVLTSALQKAGA